MVSLIFYLEDGSLMEYLWPVYPYSFSTKPYLLDLLLLVYRSTRISEGNNLLGGHLK